MMDKLTTPDSYIQSIDWNAKTALLVPMSRETYRQSSFLDHRTIAAGSPREMKLSDLSQDHDRGSSSNQRLNFIFHTSFCGSTLLSRCLDHPGICFAYKEPFLLHQLAFRKRPKWKPDDGHDTDLYLKIALGLLSRTYHETEVPLIKTSESCNNLARELLQYHPDSKALLLYSDLKSFVTSMLKHVDRRKYLRASLPRAYQDLAALGYHYPENATLSDAQIAGLVWFSLIAQHLHLLNDPLLHVSSLNATYLYECPFETLVAVSGYFGLSHDVSTLKHEVNEGNFLKDAKNTAMNYNKTQQLQKKRQLEHEFSAAIQEAEKWVYEANAQQSIPKDLPRHLLI